MANWTLVIKTLTSLDSSDVIRLEDYKKLEKCVCVCSF